MSVDIVTAQPADADELAVVAALTFPMACPQSAAPKHIAEFVEANLSATRFAEYLSDPRRAILTARHNGRIVGYAILVHDTDDRDHSVELSKLYVLADFHGKGVSSALMGAALATAAGWGARSLWLGVNQKNQRAQRFYIKSGFTVNGTRTFRLGPQLEHDYTMIRPLSS
ncbi:GNAT family N-acetyltransferase [Mycobacterium simiae]|uniref:GNAT family N-acetyltransferase n=1 Tax=Mycobacterium simiae TaxID=1784 RepID=UPI0035903009